MLRLVAALLLLLGLVEPSNAFPVRGGGGAGGTSDQLTQALSTTCSNCWLDAGAAVSTHPTVASVVWNCSTNPCGGGLPSNASMASTLQGSSGPAGVTALWSGGAYDSDDNLLTVWGGGHLGYYGNEIYGFSFATLTWSRLSVPSSMVGFTTGTSAETMPDGNPVAAHTYDGQVYVPGTGLFSIGNCGQDTGGCSGISFKQSISALSPLAYNAWSSIATIGNVLPQQVAVYDPTSKSIYLTGGFESVPLSHLDAPYTGSWTSTGGSGITQGGNQVGAIQPGVQLVVIGESSSQAIAMSLSTGNTITTSFTGGAALLACSGPGWEWDSHASEFVGWCGGTTVYLMNPSTYTISTHTISGSNTVTPQCSDAVNCTSTTGTQTNGTFGRFRYLPKYNAFAVVNSIDDHVYVYKPDF